MYNLPILPCDTTTKHLQQYFIATFFREREQERGTRSVLESDFHTRADATFIKRADARGDMRQQLRIWNLNEDTSLHPPFKRANNQPIRVHRGAYRLVASSTSKYHNQTLGSYCFSTKWAHKPTHTKLHKFIWKKSIMRSRLADSKRLYQMLGGKSTCSGSFITCQLPGGN